jgi:predicted DNA-binding protein
MKAIGPRPQRGSRDEAEDKAQAAVKTDARGRLKLGKHVQIIFRVTPETKQKLLRLAETLSAGKATPISLTQTMEQAIDALEARLKAKSNEAKP